MNEPRRTEPSTIHVSHQMETLETNRVSQPALVIHSRRDHTCPMRRNVDFMMSHLGSAQKRAVILEESFHVITVDSEKERVASEVIDFMSALRSSAEPSSAMG